MGYGQSFLDLVSDYTYGSYGQRPKMVEPLIDILKKEMEYGKKSKLLKFLKDVYNLESDELKRSYDKTQWLREGEQNPLTAGVSSSTYLRPAESTIREQEAYDSSNRDYVIKKIAEMRAAREAEFANRQSPQSVVSGGPASGGIAPPTDVVAAEKKGETAGDRAISAYKAADKTGGDYTDFSSFMADYVRRAERDTAAADAERATATSVKIDIPGGYESLQRIRQQAGGTPGGGSFSAMESTVKGGDTEEDLRAYVDNYRNTEVDRQIGLIEQAFPAAYRPPALDARLEALYQARANRDQSLAEAERTTVLRRQADAQMLGSEADFLRAANEPGIARTGAMAQVAAAQAYAGNRTSVDEASLQKFVVELGKDAASNPELREQLKNIKIIAYDRTKTPDQRYNEIIDLLGGSGRINAAVPGQNITGYPDIDAAIAPRPRG